MHPNDDVRREADEKCICSGDRCKEAANLCRQLGGVYIIGGCHRFYKFALPIGCEKCGSLIQNKGTWHERTIDLYAMSAGFYTSVLPPDYVLDLS